MSDHTPNDAPPPSPKEEEWNYDAAPDGKENEPIYLVNRGDWQLGLFGDDTDFSGYLKRVDLPDNFKFPRDYNPYQRKRVSVKHRITPCKWCRFPISQRHHFLPVSEYGENDITVQICANCHEIYHIIHTCLTKQTPSSMTKYIALTVHLGENDKRLQRALHWVKYLQDLEEKRKQKENAG